MQFLNLMRLSVCSQLLREWIAIFHNLFRQSHFILHSHEKKRKLLEVYSSIWVCIEAVNRVHQLQPSKSVYCWNSLLNFILFCFLIRPSAISLDFSALCIFISWRSLGKWRELYCYEDCNGTQYFKLISEIKSVNRIQPPRMQSLKLIKFSMQFNYDDASSGDGNKIN